MRMVGIGCSDRQDVRIDTSNEIVWDPSQKRLSRSVLRTWVIVVPELRRSFTVFMACAYCANSVLINEDLGGSSKQNGNAVESLMAARNNSVCSKSS